MASTSPYLGAKISLISNSDIRYEGTLWKLDSEASTISVAQVKSFGTEDRRFDKVVKPSSEVYDFIIFRGTDIKDIVVCEPPQIPEINGTQDPAIIEVSQKTATPGGSSSFVPSTSSYADHGGRPLRSEHGDDGSHYNGQQQQWNNSNYRGGRGGYNNRGGAQGQRGRFSHNNGSRNYDSQRNYGQRQEQNKSDMKEAFDFDANNQRLKEMEEKWKVVHSNEGDEQVERGADEPAKYYDPDNFFDAISCEALEKQKQEGGHHPGGRPNYDRNKEREINAMTFGSSAMPMNRTRSFQNQNRGGYRGGQNYGGGYQNNYQGGGYNNGGGYDNGGYNQSYAPRRGRNGFSRGYSGSQQQQQDQNVASQGPRAPLAKLTGMAKTVRPARTTGPDADWVYDDQRAVWINYKDPIAKRNELLISSIRGAAPSGQRPRQFNGPRQQQQRSSNNRQANTSLTKPRKSRPLMEVGCQKKDGVEEEKVGGRVKKMVHGRGNHDENCDKCSLRSGKVEEGKVEPVLEAVEASA